MDGTTDSPLIVSQGEKIDSPEGVSTGGLWKSGQNPQGTCG